MARRPEASTGSGGDAHTEWDALGDTPKKMTRRETDRSFEGSEQYKAIQRLKAAGLLIDFNRQGLYHGRTAKVGERGWGVDRHYNNAGNATGHANINKIAALNVAERSVAEDYAGLRSHREGGRGELHQIQSSDPDAVVIDRHFSPSRKRNGERRTPEERRQLEMDLARTMPDLTDAVPLDFDQRTALERMKPSEFYRIAGKKPMMEQYFTAEDVAKIAAQSGLAEDTVRKMCSAMNTREMLVKDPGYAARNFLIGRQQTKPDEKHPGALLSQEYFASWAQGAHVVGVSRRVKSPNIGRDFRASYLFELGKVDSAENLEAQREARWRKTGRMAMRMDRLMGRESSPRSPFQQVLRNPHATGEEIVGAAKKVADFGRIFEADSGVKEGYTLEEHTETVIRNFDENYADKIPTKLVPLMHLALLVHDIGKPEAAAKGEKSNQKVYNDRESRRFMRKVGVGPRTIELVTGMIGHAQELTTKGYVRGDKGAQAELDGFCMQMLEQLGMPNPTAEDASGLRDLCLMIQSCDSAAYTTMARTRDTKTGVTYRNKGSFNGTFMPPTGQNKRDIRMRGLTSWIWD